MANPDWLLECCDSLAPSDLSHFLRGLEKRLANRANPTFEQGLSTSQSEQAPGPPHSPALSGPTIARISRPATLTSSAQSSATTSLSSIDLNRADNAFVSTQTLVSQDLHSPTTHGSQAFNVCGFRNRLHLDNTKAVPNKLRPSTAVTKGPYYCPLCHERGAQTSCKTKHDWKRHVNKFHETNTEWRCSTCADVFERDVDANKHSRHHRGHSNFIQTHLPARRAYACGFMHCRFYTSTFEHWIDHVADCMVKNPGEDWSYDRRVRNLLKHALFSQSWKDIRDHWLKVCQLELSAIYWTIESSNQTREQLERVMYGSDLQEALERLFWQGHPQHNLSNGFIRTGGDIDEPMTDVQSNDINVDPGFPTSSAIPQYDEGRLFYEPSGNASTSLRVSSYANQRVAMPDSSTAIDPFLGHTGGFFQQILGQGLSNDEGIPVEDFLREDTYPDSMNTTPPLPQEQTGSPTTPSKLRSLFRGTTF